MHEVLDWLVGFLLFMRKAGRAGLRTVSTRSHLHCCTLGLARWMAPNAFVLVAPRREKDLCRAMRSLNFRGELKKFERVLFDMGRKDSSTIHFTQFVPHAESVGLHACHMMSSRCRLLLPTTVNDR
jgi:hypothetical protein